MSTLKFAVGSEDARRKEKEEEDGRGVCEVRTNATLDARREALRVVFGAETAIGGGRHDDCFRSCNERAQVKQSKEL